MKNTTENCHSTEAYRMVRMGDEAYAIKHDFTSAAKCYELAAQQFEAAGLSGAAASYRAKAKEIAA